MAREEYYLFDAEDADKIARTSRELDRRSGDLHDQDPHRSGPRSVSVRVTGPASSGNQGMFPCVIINWKAGALETETGTPGGTLVMHEWDDNWWSEKNEDDEVPDSGWLIGPGSEEDEMPVAAIVVGEHPVDKTPIYLRGVSVVSADTNPFGPPCVAKTYDGDFLTDVNFFQRFTRDDGSVECVQWPVCEEGCEPTVPGPPPDQPEISTDDPNTIHVTLNVTSGGTLVRDVLVAGSTVTTNASGEAWVFRGPGSFTAELLDVIGGEAVDWTSDGGFLGPDSGSGAVTDSFTCAGFGSTVDVVFNVTPPTTATVIVNATHTGGGSDVGRTATINGVTQSLASGTTTFTGVVPSAARTCACSTPGGETALHTISPGTGAKGFTAVWNCVAGTTYTIDFSITL